MDFGQAEDRKPRALNRAELGILLAALPAEWEPFFRFLAQTGVRISEALGLEWQDVREPPRIKVTPVLPGAGAPDEDPLQLREVPLSPGMAATLLAHRAKPLRRPREPPVDHQARRAPG